MFTSFTLKNFRCFRELHIEPLDRVNLITGKNNTGKTALLEAIFLQLGPNNPRLSLTLHALRGGLDQVHVEAEELWGWLFFGRDIDETSELVGTCGERQHILQLRLEEPEESRFVPNDASEKQPVLARSLTTTTGLRDLVWHFRDTGGQEGISRLSLSMEGMRIIPARLAPLPVGIFLPARVRFPQEDAGRFSKLEQIGRQDEILAPLRLLESRLKRLAVLVTGDVPVIHGDIGIGRMVPISMMGEGTGRLLSMLLAIANAPDGTVLIDEIENGLHHSVLASVWHALAQAARQANVQLFATTHSYECVTAAHEAFVADGVYDMRVHRLERVGEDIKAVTYDQESLDVSLEQSWEIR